MASCKDGDVEQCSKNMRKLGKCILLNNKKYYIEYIDDKFLQLYI